MAKTGFYLRGAKGKLAGATIYRGATGTIMREINTNPTDAKTVAMYSQQAKFRACAMLFKVFSNALEQKAYENKKPGTSDYNIFVKENVNKCVPYVKEVADNYQYPTVYCENAVMSRGSLPSPQYLTLEHTDEYQHYPEYPTFVVPNIENATTIGELSQAIMDKYGLFEGDIVTLALAVGNMNPGANHYASFNGPAFIYQFYLVPTDTRLISDVLPWFSVSEDGIVANDRVSALAVYFSRETQQGLLVSTSTLTYSNMLWGFFAGILSAGTGGYGGALYDIEKHLRKVALSYGAVEKNVILAGSKAAAPIPAPSIITLTQNPIVLSDGNGETTSNTHTIVGTDVNALQGAAIITSKGTFYGNIIDAVEANTPAIMWSFSDQWGSDIAVATIVITLEAAGETPAGAVVISNVNADTLNIMAIKLQDGRYFACTQGDL